MMRTWQQLHRALNRHSGCLLLAGLGGVAWFNWRLWRRDHALASQMQAERQPTPRLAQTPLVSALVAAWNEGERIDEHIRSFLVLTYPHIELILCAGGRDDTLARARRYAGAGVIVLEQLPGEGKQRALARCLQHASGSIIYLTDADCVFDNEALVRLLEPIVNEGENVTTGSSRPLDAQMGRLLPAHIWSSDAVAAARSGKYVDGLLGRNAAIARRVLDQIGGLDFAAITGTDYHLAQRLLAAGAALRFVGDSVVQSAYPETIGEYRRRQSRWLRNLLIYGRRYGAWNDVRVTLHTLGAGLFVSLAPLAAVLLGRIMLAAWALLVAHATLSKLRYALFAAQLSQRQIPLLNILLALPLTLIDFVIWALPIVDLLHVKTRERW